MVSTAAIVENHYGKGTLLYEGTILSQELQQKVMHNVLAEAGLIGPDQALPENVRVRHGVNRAGKTLHYYLNYSSHEQKVAYGYRNGTDLLSNRAVASKATLTLEPWGVAIVEE